LFYETDPFATTWQLLSTFRGQEGRRNIQVASKIDAYNNLHEVGVGQPHLFWFH